MSEEPFEQLPDTDRGYGLWRRKEPHGGYSYWCDDIGGGRRVFDEGLDDWGLLEEIKSKYFSRVE